MKLKISHLVLVCTFLNFSQPARAGEEKELFKQRDVFAAHSDDLAALKGLTGVTELSFGLLGLLASEKPDVVQIKNFSPYVHKEAALIQELSSARQNIFDLNVFLAKNNMKTLYEEIAQNAEMKAVPTDEMFRALRQKFLQNGWKNETADAAIKTLLKRGLLKRAFWVGASLFVIADGIDRTQLAVRGYDPTVSPMITRAVSGTEEIFAPEESSSSNSHH